MTKNIKNHKTGSPTKAPSKRAQRKVLDKIPAAWLAVFLVALLVAALFFALWLFRSPSASTLKTGGELAPINLTAGKKLYHNVFGDHFSNDLSVNMGETTFFYDRTTTAFTFTPLYSWSESSTCASQYCDGQAADYLYPGLAASPISDAGGSLNPGLKNSVASQATGNDLTAQKYCLGSRCLEVSGSLLLYQGKKIAAPAVLKGAEILNMTIYPLSSDWLVGYVINKNGVESGRAYRFNGTKFTDLDLKDKIPLQSRAGFEGAYFGFGGDDNNFLVLYGGYDLQGYQVVGSQLTDLKYWFGLRTAGGGFAPMALKREKEGETLWYICSRLNGRPRFIKLWQNGSDSIKGSLSFSEEFFKGNEQVDSAWCRLGEKADEVEIITGQNGVYKQYIFTDRGFEQNREYKLTSANLFKDTGLVRQARFDGLLACSETSCGASAIGNNMQFFGGVKSENLESVALGQDIIFKESAAGLYWKILASSQPGRADYSPWIDALAEISYAWEK